MVYKRGQAPPQGASRRLDPVATLTGPSATQVDSSTLESSFAVPLLSHHHSVIWRRPCYSQGLVYYCSTLIVDILTRRVILRQRHLVHVAGVTRLPHQEVLVLHKWRLSS